MPVNNKRSLLNGDLNMHTRRLGASKTVAVVAIFAALNVITDSLMSPPELPSGVWYSWNFLMEPLTGIALGPFMGSAATLIGVMIGHYVYFINVYEFVFTIGAPIGAAVAALLFKGKWKAVLSYYTVLFAAYFVTPVAWQLPFWGMWDTYTAFAFLIAVVFLIEKGLWAHDSRRLPLILATSAFVGLEADVLFRIFLLIPAQTYHILELNVETLQVIWVSGAVITPIKVALSTAATVAVGHPLVKALRKISLHPNQ
jgi:predicted membrane protein